MVISGIVHFLKPNIIARMIPTYIPFRFIWPYITGVLFVLAGISITLMVKTKISAFTLGCMILLFAIIVHMKGFLKGTPIASALFVRDIAIAGSAFFIASQSKD